MRIKKAVSALTLLALLLSMPAGCGQQQETQNGQLGIVATAYPVYYLTQRICSGIPEIQVSALVQEPVSCLHNYSITTDQMKKLDRADVLVMNGAGFEEFLESALVYVPEEKRIDASAGLALLPGEDEEWDPHLWLSPEKYSQQCTVIAAALSERYPQYAQQLQANAALLETELAALETELSAELAGLTCRKLITFHDGFSYFAQAFDLTILAAVEEEEGAEAPARELKAICQLIADNQIPAIFVERNGSDNASSIIAAETGAGTYVLNTMMDGETDYFTAMRENVQAVKEALS